MTEKEKKSADISKSKIPVKPANSTKSKTKTPVKGKNLLDIVNDLMANGKLSLYIDSNEKPFAEISDCGSEKTFCYIYILKISKDGWPKSI